MVAPVGPVHPSTHPNYTKDQWNTVLILAFVQFSNLAVYSFQGPLFPPEATLKGLVPSEYGFIMASFMAGMAFGSFFVIKFEKLGLRNVVVGSNCTIGIGAILLGLVSNIESPQLFAIASALSLFIQGIGNAGTLGSVYLLCLAVFPTKTSTAIGIIESGCLFGTCFGGLFAELLFVILGFQFTYITVGILILIYSIFILYKLPQEPQPTGNHLTVSDMLRGYMEIITIPSVLLFLIVLGFLEMGGDFLNTILEPGLQPFHLSHIQVGLTFFSLGLPQLLSPVWGYTMDKMQRPEILLIISLFLLSFSTFLLGPLPFIPLERSYKLTIAGLLLNGLGQGLMDVSAVVNFQLEVKERRFGESLAVNFSFVAVLYPLLTGIGGVAGPSLAGIAYQYLGFQSALICIFISHGLLGTVLVIFMFSRKCKPRNIALTQSLYEALD